VSELLPAGARAVFFDAVGTLIHPEPPAAVVYAEVGRRHGSRLDLATVRTRFVTAFRREEERDRQQGWRTDEAREVKRWQTIVAAVLQDARDTAACFRDLYEHFARADAWRCYAEVGPVLQALAGRGYELGVASNFDSRLRGVVAGLPALAPLRRLVISSEVGWRKPAPAFFDAVCRSAGLSAERIVLVGDDLDNDYVGAQQAGLCALLLDPEGRGPVPASERLARLDELAP
jgi:putative hydrolase of the HAD superfamily